MEKLHEKRYQGSFSYKFILSWAFSLFHPTRETFIYEFPWNIIPHTRWCIRNEVMRICKVIKLVPLRSLKVGWDELRSCWFILFGFRCCIPLELDEIWAKVCWLACFCRWFWLPNIIGASIICISRSSLTDSNVSSAQIWHLNIPAVWRLTEFNEI